LKRAFRFFRLHWIVVVAVARESSRRSETKRRLPALRHRVRPAHQRGHAQGWFRERRRQAVLPFLQPHLDRAEAHARRSAGL